MTPVGDGSMEEVLDCRTPAPQNKDGSPHWGVPECRIMTFKSLLIECEILRKFFQGLAFHTLVLISD
jgi:hypothetical protein